MKKKTEEKTRKDLEEEIYYLRAMLHKCIKCYRESNIGDMVEIELWGKLKRERKHRYQALFHVGGAYGGAGPTMKAAMQAAMKHALTAIPEYGRLAMKRPRISWRPDRE